MVATVVLVISHPVKLLAIIQIILTAFVAVALVTLIMMALWVHSMTIADPVRQLWQPRLLNIGGVIWFGALIPWFLFTVFHVIVAIRKKQNIQNVKE